MLIFFFFFCIRAVPKRNDDYPMTHWKRHNLKEGLKKRLKGNDGEMKTPEQIVRERIRLETIKNRERFNKQTKNSKKKRSFKKKD